MLLTEDRISAVKEKYSIPTEVWEPMVSGSASIAKNQKYLEWIAKQWEGMVSTPSKVQQQRIEGNVWTGTLNGLLTTIEEFDRVRPNLKKKDLYQYRDRQEVIDSLEDYKLDKVRNIGTHKESEVVFEDTRYKVVVPKSHSASCYYGAGTKWCTAAKDNPGHFTSYDKSGKLFYILDKSAPTSNQFYKVALNRTYKGRDTFYDSKDDSITDTNEISDIMSHPELMTRISEYFTFSYADEIAKISEEEKQAELVRIARDAEWAERRRVRELRLQQTADARKDNDEWKIGETGVVGTMANALMVWLVDFGNFNLDNESDIEEKIDEISEMRLSMEEDPQVIADPDGERAQDYGEDLNNLEEELELLKDEEQYKVYDIRYEEYDHYGLPLFEYEDATYAVGNDSMADEAAWDQVDSLIDDIGYDGFTGGFMEYYIDGDAVADYMEEWFYDDMNDRPEDYLDEDDRELTDEAEEKIDDIDGDIGEAQEELEGLENEDEGQEILDRIEELENYKEEITEDDDSWEYTEAAKDEYVESRKTEARDDPMMFLRDWGMEDRVSDFIDKDAFIQGVLDTDGRGNGLSSYDGDEGEFRYKDEWYYIYRTD